MRVGKAHAYGNDFLYVREEEARRRGLSPDELARAMCARHTGIGADGLILYEPAGAGARMRLVNADGSPSEVSGNGVRGLAAWLARERDLAEGAILIETDAGPKTLTLLERPRPNRCLFRAHMGQPTDIEACDVEVRGERLHVVRLRVGNPQCVLLGALDPDRLARMGPALQRHPAFPEGVNLELADVVSPGHVRILIWERGVGPTQSSGTGSCAAAVAAALHGGAARDVDVEAPGGTQHVSWTDEGLQLTGWAEVVLDGEWVG